MAPSWSARPYDEWSATCDTLHAHTQVLGKLAARLAAPEPQLQHAALRLTARGWETAPLPAPDGSGVFVVALDLRAHAAIVEHSDGRVSDVALTPDRPVAEVTQGVLAAVRDLAGAVEIDPTPQEVTWSVPLDEDFEHASYDTGDVRTYFAAATRAALVLASFRAPYRGRSTPVNAWWGSFDLAVSLFSGVPADPPANDFIMRNAMDSQEVAVGWWPGDARYRNAAFYAYAYPAHDGFPTASRLTARGSLGQGSRRVRPRLQRPELERGSSRHRPVLRAVGVPARMHRLRMGSRAVRERRRAPAARGLAHNPRAKDVGVMAGDDVEAVVAQRAQTLR